MSISEKTYYAMYGIDIDAINKNSWKYRVCNELQDIRNEIKSLSTISPNKNDIYKADVIGLIDEKIKNLSVDNTYDNWVLCKDRLPKSREDVLVTCFIHESWQVKPGYFDGEKWVVTAYYKVMDGIDVNVIAWQYLPKPYKVVEKDIKEKEKENEIEFKCLLVGDIFIYAGEQGIKISDYFDETNKTPNAYFHYENKYGFVQPNLMVIRVGSSNIKSYKGNIDETCY